MSLLDPAERSARGRAAQEKLVAAQPPAPVTLYDSSWPDFVFAEVWSRPGLDLRARFLVSLASAACAADEHACRSYARGALAEGHLSLAELREAALHLAAYGGWSAGGVLDRGTSGAAAQLGLANEPFSPIRAEPWEPEQRHQDGAAAFLKVMLFGGPPPQTAYFEGGILNYVFGEMWTRPGLDERSRRWLTLVGVGFSSASIPIRSHVWSALASGNASREEMLEFVLQYSIHAGWPRGSVMQSAVLEQAPRAEQGLPFQP
jgi:4-carboxymuconolactone decarboxylase